MTASFEGSRMQSRRRMTMNGRITFPYSDCLKSPRRISAMDQTNEPRAPVGVSDVRSCPASCRLCGVGDATALSFDGPANSWLLLSDVSFRRLSDNPSKGYLFLFSKAF